MHRLPGTLLMLFVCAFSINLLIAFNCLITSKISEQHIRSRAREIVRKERTEMDLTMQAKISIVYTKKTNETHWITTRPKNGRKMFTSISLYRETPYNAFDDVAKKVETKTANAFLKSYRQRCQYSAPAMNLVTRKSQIKLCNCVPPVLGGRYQISLEEADENQVGDTHKEVKLGGHWKPLNCTSRFRVAVIVPFMGRQNHLPIFLKYLHPFLQRQQLDYRIFVVEQAYPELFNKAGMMNIGFLEAMKLAHFDCVVFHDVDMIPEDDRNLYTCLVAPRHVGAFIDKFDYRICCGVFFGGVTLFTVKQFQALNGYSNQYWGWGGEDDDMGMRVYRKGFQIYRYPKEVSRFKMIRHTRDKQNIKGKTWRLTQLKKEPERDGLNSIKYKVLYMKNRALYTWVYVNLTVPR